MVAVVVVVVVVPVAAATVPSCVSLCLLVSSVVSSVVAAPLGVLYYWRKGHRLFESLVGNHGYKGLQILLFEYHCRYIPRTYPTHTYT